MEFRRISLVGNVADYIAMRGSIYLNALLGCDEFRLNKSVPFV